MFIFFLGPELWKNKRAKTRPLVGHDNDLNDDDELIFNDNPILGNIHINLYDRDMCPEVKEQTIKLQRCKYKPGKIVIQTNRKKTSLLKHLSNRPLDWIVARRRPWLKCLWSSTL